MTLAELDERRDSTTELLPARADTDSWIQVVRDVSILAQQIAETEFVPKGLRGSVPATAAAILYGREVGLPPMTALSQISVIDGRPGMSAEAMRALVIAAGHEIVFDESTSSTCRIRGRRLRSQTWIPVEWTIDHARRAGLLRRGGAWEFYPREMLIARATTTLCRMLFPDVIHGFRSVEELHDLDGQPGQDDASAEESAAIPRPRRTRSVSRRPRKASEQSSSDAPSESTGVVDSESAPGVSSLPEEQTDKGSEGPAQQPERDSAAPPIPTLAETKREKTNAINTVTTRIIFGQLRRLGLRDKTPEEREHRLRILARLVDRDELDSTNDLTQDEGQTITTILSTLRDVDQLDELLGHMSIREIATPIEDTTAKDEDTNDEDQDTLPGMDGE